VGRELPLDLVDELEVEVEQPAQVLDHEHQVPLPVRQRRSGTDGVVEGLLELGDVLSERL
jgi:hypothetical protein